MFIASSNPERANEIIVKYSGRQWCVNKLWHSTYSVTFMSGIQTNYSGLLSIKPKRSKNLVVDSYTATSLRAVFLSSDSRELRHPTAFFENLQQVN